MLALAPIELSVECEGLVEALAVSVECEGLVDALVLPLLVEGLVEALLPALEADEVALSSAPECEVLGELDDEALSLELLEEDELLEAEDEDVEEEVEDEVDVLVLSSTPERPEPDDPVPPLPVAAEVPPRSSPAGLSAPLRLSATSARLDWVIMLYGLMGNFAIHSMQKSCHAQIPGFGGIEAESGSGFAKNWGISPSLGWGICRIPVRGLTDHAGRHR